MALMLKTKNVKYHKNPKLVHFKYLPWGFRFRLRFLFFILSLLVMLGGGFLLFRVSPTFALTRSHRDIFDNPELVVQVECSPIVKVSRIELVRFNGLPLIGNTIELDASRVKIFAQVPTFSPSPFNSSCDTYYAGISAEGFEWELLSRPAGSSAMIENATSLTPSLQLDQPGEYKIKFTACANGSCQIWINNKAWSVVPASKTFTIEALSEIAIPPETEPAVPSMMFIPKTELSDEGALCGDWPDFLSPAWHTIEPWDGPEDYELVEGVVGTSRSSTGDNNLNHDVLDFVFYVEPDPPFRRLLAKGELDSLEVEWERHNFHPMSRPTKGDRVSAVGYWINDCGHHPKTEIHPPVMVATHKARPIRLPESEGYGTNIYLPGIVSTVFLSRDAGEGTRNCSTTGLYETREVVNILPNQQVSYNCLPNDKGYSGNPIDTVYTYNIYLPRNPLDIYAEHGRNAPAADLFYKLYYPFGNAGPDPIITECLSNEGLTYLEVRIDLRSYTGRIYGRRIEAGWIYPSPDNWDIKQWRLRVNSI